MPFIGDAALRWAPTPIRLSARRFCAMRAAFLVELTSPAVAQPSAAGVRGLGSMGLGSGQTDRGASHRGRKCSKTGGGPCLPGTVLGRVLITCTSEVLCGEDWKVFARIELYWFLISRTHSDVTPQNNFQTK